MAHALDEILLSSDKTIAIIDGSGVLADPAGLDREELIRLAKARKMISNFDRSKLGKDGYVVLVEDQDVKLPCRHCFVPIIFSMVLIVAFSSWRACPRWD